MTAAALTPRQATNLALGIRAGRPAAAAIHDAIVARLGRALPDFKTVALGLGYPVEAFRQALLSAATAKPPWHHVLLAELARAGPGLPGAAGGLCLDHRLRLIGLHPAAVWHPTEVDDRGKPRLDYNRAVLLASIQAARPDLGDPDPLHDRISQLSDGSGPVIGRASTQATLRRMATGQAPPILVVKGAPQSGKSCTPRCCVARFRARGSGSSTWLTAI